MALPTPLQAFSGVPKNTASADKQTIIDGEKMTGAQALIRALEDLGVQDVFGLPGGAILPVFHAINDDTKFRFTLVDRKSTRLNSSHVKRSSMPSSA